jgi:KDO2-lipid IV(A) lauroyltransferase
MLLFAARVMHRVPLGAALAIGRGLGRLAPRLSPRHFRRVRRDIELAFGAEMSAREIMQTARRFYLRLGESLVEFLRLPYLTVEEIGRGSILEGTEHLDAVLARGKGAILFTGHLGNWEMMAAVVGLTSYRITAIIRPQADDAITTLFNRIREAHGLKVVPMTDVRTCLRVLKRNECLGIVGDVNANIPGAFVQFLGRPAATYTGAAYLAAATGAEILPIFDERLPDLRHHIRIGAPIPLARTGDTPRDLLVNTMRVQYVLQREIRRRPQDWFWLLNRWKTRPESVPTPERIPMEHRDLTPEEARDALAPVMGKSETAD